MSPPNRLAAAGGAVALVEAAAGTAALAALGPERIALFLLACALATAAVTASLRLLIGRGSGPGGSTGDGPPGRGPGGPGPDDPPWWPDFERRFREHVERRKREGARG